MTDFKDWTPEALIRVISDSTLKIKELEAKLAEAEDKMQVMCLKGCELEAKLAEADKFNQLLKHKLTDRSTLSVKGVAVMGNKLKVAVEALEIITGFSHVNSSFTARDALEKLKASK